MISLFYYYYYYLDIFILHGLFNHYIIYNVYFITLTYLILLDSRVFFNILILNYYYIGLTYGVFYNTYYFNIVFIIVYWVLLLFFIDVKSWPAKFIANIVNYLVASVFPPLASLTAADIVIYVLMARWYKYIKFQGNNFVQPNSANLIQVAFNKKKWFWL